jgi:soluble lytic murein transglycosylase-like protein
MDLTQKGQTFVTDYGDTMTALRNQDDQQRAFVNARKERALRDGQQAPDDTQQVAAEGNPNGVQMPASPDASVPTTPGAPILKAPPPTSPIPDQNPYLGRSVEISEAEKRLAALKQYGQPQAQPSKNPLYDVAVAPNAKDERAPDRNMQAAQERIGTLRDLDLKSRQDYYDSPQQIALRAADAKTQLAANSGGTAPGTPTSKPTPYDGIINQAATDAGIDPDLFKRLIASESSFNPGAISPKGKDAGLGIAQIAAVHGLSDADRMNPAVALPFAAKLFAQYVSASGGNVQEALMKYKGASSPAGRQSMSGIVQRVANAAGSMIPSANAGEVPQQPQQPQAQQGPKFTAADGSQFTLPTAYTDGMVQQAQQQLVQAKNAMQLAWMRYQNGSAPDLTTVQAAQAQIQHLQQGLYNADIYAKTQQAQGGNPQAFSALLNEYSNKIGQPVQLVPMGNGTYALKAKGGQLIDQGDPAHIAGTLGGVLNSEARAINMEIQKKYAMESATARAQEDAKHPIEIAKLQNALQIKLSENDTAMLKQALENKKPTTLALPSGQVVTYNPANTASPFTFADPVTRTPAGGVRIDQPLVRP